MSVLADGTEEQATLDQLEVLEQEAAKPIEPKRIPNELDELIENVDYIAKHVPKLDQFLSGLKKNLEHDMKIKMLGDDYKPFLQHEFSSMANLLGGEVASRTRTILMYHGENMRSVE